MIAAMDIGLLVFYWQANDISHMRRGRGLSPPVMGRHFVGGDKPLPYIESSQV
jgi:hypothetical protein